MVKRILAVVMTLCLLLTVVPMATVAADEGLSVVKADGTSVEADENGIFSLTDGTYTVSGEAKDAEALCVE